MKLFYAVCFLLLSSCTTRLRYIGNSFPQSRQVDIHVDPSSITKPYTIMGKGFVSTSQLASDKYIEKIQPLALKKAKQKGADAILIQDDYLVAATMGVRTTLRTDSVGRGRVAVGSTTIQPSTEQRFTVLFLKYNE